MSDHRGTGDAWAEGWPPSDGGDPSKDADAGSDPSGGAGEPSAADGADGGDSIGKPKPESDSDPVEPTVPSDYAGEALGSHPLFALPNAWLFPGAVMPLMVFEPRYVQMVEDLLDRSGRLVIGTVQDGWENDMQGMPPVHPVAGFGEIGRHERRPDGRYVIVVVGLGRVLVEECESDRLYRQVDVRKIADRPLDACDPLRERLVDAIGDLAPEAKDIDAQVPLGRLADFLLLRLSPGHDVLRQVYPELDELRRAERVLEVYDARH